MSAGDLQFSATASAAPEWVATAVRDGANVLVVADDELARSVALSLFVNLADPSSGLVYLGWDTLSLLTARRALVHRCPPDDAAQTAARYLGAEGIELLAMGSPHAATGVGALVIAAGCGMQIIAAAADWTEVGRMTGVLPPRREPAFDLSASVTDGCLLVTPVGQSLGSA